MKRITAVLVLFALVTVGAFAQIQMSAGGGIFGDFSFGNGYKFEYSEVGLSQDFVLSVPNLTFGAFGFFDATYVEASVYLGYGIGALDMEATGLFNETESFGVNFLQFGFTLLGKYPFDLGAITLFPMAGIGYNLVLSAVDEDGDSWEDAGDLSQFSILFGVGMDYDLSESMYLRASLLFNLRFPSKAAGDFEDIVEAEIGMPINSIPGASAGTTLGFGPRISVGVGFRF